MNLTLFRFDYYFKLINNNKLPQSQDLNIKSNKVRYKHIAFYLSFIIYYNS